MKKIHDRRLAFPVIVAALSVLSACGSSGPAADGASVGADRLQSGAEISGKNTSGVNLEAWADSGCGYADGIFGPMMEDIAQRFSRAVESARQTGLDLDYAGHPDAPGGVSIMACADGKIAASASKSQVFISDGLLSLLAGAAEAKISSDGSIDDYNARLDGMIAAITAGETSPTPSALSGPALDLASSAVAFVVYHEIAHTQMDKLAPDGDTGDQSSTEMKADIFAAQAVTETGYDINGVDIVFEALARAVPSGSMDHPSTEDRAKIAMKAGRGETLDGFTE